MDTNNQNPQQPTDTQQPAVGVPSTPPAETPAEPKQEVPVSQPATENPTPVSPTTDTTQTPAPASTPTTGEEKPAEGTATPTTETPAGPATDPAAGTPPPATPPGAPGTPGGDHPTALVTPVHHGKNPMFLAIPVVLIVAIVGGVAAYMMTSQKQAEAPQVQTLQAPTMKKVTTPTPTPTATLEQLQAEVEGMQIGDATIDTTPLDADLQQL